MVTTTLFSKSLGNRSVLPDKARWDSFEQGSESHGPYHGVEQPVVWRLIENVQAAGYLKILRFPLTHRLKRISSTLPGIGRFRKRSPQVWISGQSQGKKIFHITDCKVRGNSSLTFLLQGKENSLEIPSDCTTSPVTYKFLHLDNLEIALDHAKVDQEEHATIAWIVLGTILARMAVPICYESGKPIL